MTEPTTREFGPLITPLHAEQPAAGTDALVQALLADVQRLHGEVTELKARLARLEGRSATGQPVRRRASEPAPAPRVERPLSYWAANVPNYDEPLDSAEAERYLNRVRISPQEVTLSEAELARQPRYAPSYGKYHPGYDKYKPASTLGSMIFWALVATTIIMVGLLLLLSMASVGRV
jgi:hypothetical protein